VTVALAEFLRVLNDDGFAVITCPDLMSGAKLIADDLLTEPADQSGIVPIAPLDILYGHRASLAKGNLYMGHRCGFTQKVLTGTLQAARFKSVASACIPQDFALWALASKSGRGEAELRELAHLHFP
jgi:hypothetical protein